MQTIHYSTYYDKVFGGWFGKCLGGAAGAPVEGIKGDIETTMREVMNPNLPNDDLDLQLLWLEVLEKKGMDLTSDDMAEAWINQCWYPFGEYGYFTKNYMRGIHPPLSGKFNNYYFHEGMGCPIRSEIWAMVNPGNPEEAIRLAIYDATLDHVGDSVWAEVFLAALQSICFVSDNLYENIDKALTYITEDCKFLRCARMVMDEYNKGTAFKEIVKLIQIDYSHPDFTNSIQNMGYIILALLFGKGDLEKTIDLALCCGYDADCTCASAAAVVGIINGYNTIPDNLKSLLNDQYVCGIDVVRSDNKISTLAYDTCRVGMEISKHFNVINIELGPETKNDKTIEKYLSPFHWKTPEDELVIEINYLDSPGIGYMQDCPIEIILQNKTNQPMDGTVKLFDFPEGCIVSHNNIPVHILAGAMEIIRVNISVSHDVTVFSQTNIISAGVYDVNSKEIARYTFGVVGAVVWNAYGPFIEPRHFEPDPNLPHCHGGVGSLPVVETMFANMAQLDKEYLDEDAFIMHTEDFQPIRVMNSIDDFIDVDSNFGLIGEAVFYVATDIVFDEDTTKWIVCGNSDAYKLWINGKLIQNIDEFRNWQPQCHGDLVNFKKGANRIAIKLLRRAETLKFSFGIREYTAKHYHAQRWCTNYKSQKI